MRGVSKAAVRSGAAVVIVLMMSLTPLEARPLEGGKDGWFKVQRERIAKVVKRGIMALGDGLTIPWP